MDPVSQGALGAAVTLALFTRSQRFSPKLIAWLGALSAMAPDLDVLIRSSSDSLLAIEYHRHFTHSLAFAPIGAAIAILPWLGRADIRRNWKHAWFIAFTGYLTHAPLDCATTYGTLYFWPFSDYRVSLSYISVVDLVFTLPLLGFVIYATVKSRPLWAAIGLALGLSYIGLGAVQKKRIESLQSELIEARGHTASRAAVYGTFMNQVTWRSLYESEGTLYVDQLRQPYWGESCLTPGQTIAPSKLPANAGPGVRRGFRLINWFSSGWVATSTERPNLYSDLRYSFQASGTAPFWGVEVNTQADSAEWVNTRNERKMKPSAIVDLIFRIPRNSICGSDWRSRVAPATHSQGSPRTD